MNLRYELRAYEDTNACRLASILLKLTSKGRQVVTRDEVATHWAERYPRHAAQSGRRSVRSRLSDALTLLKVAEIAQPDGPNIVVVHAARLKQSADNLQIVEDEEGMAVRPGLWSRRPSVPLHLQAVQASLEAQRLDSTKE